MPWNLGHENLTTEIRKYFNSINKKDKTKTPLLINQSIFIYKDKSIILLHIL